MVKLFYAKILKKPPANCLQPTENNEYIFSGHIEIEHAPYSDVNSKKVYIRCFDCFIGQQQLDIKEEDINVSYKQALDGNHERWYFEHTINKPQKEEVIINFTIRYAFYNTQTGKTEEYWDTNDAKNYTLTTTFDSKAPLVLGKSDIALYDIQKAKPCEPYGSFLIGANVFLKNYTYDKDVKIVYSSRRRSEWEHLPNPQIPTYDANAHWEKGFDNAELWNIYVRKDEIESQYNLACTYTYPDGRKVDCVDNNFSENYSL